MSTTSDIYPVLLGELLTLKTDMGLEIVWVLILLEQTKSQSMKLLVALQSKSTFTEWSSLMSVVLSSTTRTKDIPYVSSTLAENCLGSLHSHFGFQEGGLTLGVERRNV